MLVGRVVDDELGQHADVQRVRCVDEPLEVVQCAVDGIDRRVVRDVVPVVSKRRRIEGEQPQARDAEVVQVRKLLCEPGEIADTVRIAVVEGADVHLVDDCVFVPERIGVTVSEITGSNDEDVCHPLGRIQLYIVPFALPGVTRLVEQIFDDVRLARVRGRAPRSGTRTRPCCMP